MTKEEQTLKQAQYFADLADSGWLDKAQAVRNLEAARREYEEAKK